MEIIVLVKRAIFLKIFCLFVFACYGVLLVLGAFGVLFFNKFWFSLFLFCIGLVFLARFFCFQIESNLFVCVLLLFVGASGIVAFFVEVSTILRIATYVLSLALSELAVFVKFRQIFHLKTFSFEFVCVILLVLLNFNLLPLPAFVAVSCVIGAAAAGMIGSAVRINMRKV